MVAVTQKVPMWLRLTSTGRPGHGSAPQTETSVTKLVRGLKRISETEFPVRVTDPVATMFEGRASYQQGAEQARRRVLRDDLVLTKGTKQDLVEGGRSGDGSVHVDPALVFQGNRVYEERGGFSGAKYTTYARFEATQTAHYANP